MNRLYCIWN